MTTPRLRILDVPVSCISHADVEARVHAAISGAEGLRILAVNPEKIIRARRDAELSACLEDAELLIPDGIGVVVALRWLCGVRVARLAGADLMIDLCAQAEERGYPIFLLGASEQVSSAAQVELLRRFPQLQVAGRLNGFNGLSDEATVIRRIRESGARILFVALGSPQQEKWIARNWTKLEPIVIQGVGGTLDVLAGTVKRAPESWRALGLEWLYRLLSQPSRIRRQSALPIFLFRVLVSRFSITREH